MKRLLISSLAASLALPVGAQVAREATPVDATFRAAEGYSLDVPKFTQQSGTGAKTTAATAFITDTFNTNSIGSGGWVAGGNTGTRSWTIANTGTNYMSALRSTTASTGYLRYDAFAIGAAFPGTNPQIGTVTSPAYNCTGHSFVGVRFQQYVRRLADSFWVDVSSDNFVTTRRYPVYPNNNVAGNGTTDNPIRTTINISAVAANQPSVKVRFVYSGHYTGTGTSGSGGTYGWQVDDFQLVDLDAVDLSLSKSSLLMRLDASQGLTPMGVQPTLFADTVHPVTYVANLGGSAQSNVNVSATINAVGGGAALWNRSVVFNNIAINGFDSLADFTVYPGYKTTTRGNYYAAYNVAATGDGEPANNLDTVQYSISDSSLAVFSGYNEASKTLTPAYWEGGWYVHGTNISATSGPVSSYWGSFFEVPEGKSDTVTSISFAMHPNSVAGQTVQFEIYQFNPAVGGGTASWTYVARSRNYTLTANDISTTTNLRFATVSMDITAQRRFFVPLTGTYAAVMRPVNPTANIIILSATPAANPLIVGNYAVSDTASGSAFTFASLFPNPSGYRSAEAVPAVVVNFGNSRAFAVGVKEIAGVTVGKAFPNPANNTFNVPVSVTSSKNVTVTISNMLGQTLKTQALGNLGAGQSQTAVFNTSDLASGIYVYSVEANGERLTGRVVISH